MYARGYLTYDRSGFALHEYPAIQTPSGIAYRKFDVNSTFRKMSIWNKPKPVAPNSYIEDGPIWGANFVCPKGDFTVKGELRGSRISVPNGTLIVEGDVLDSFLAGRKIVTHGLIARTVEVGTVVSNEGSVGPNNKLINIAANRPVVGYIPRQFAQVAGR